MYTILFPNNGYRHIYKITKSMKMIGTDTGNLHPLQAHDEERDEEGGQGIGLNLLELEIPDDFTDTQCLHND